MFNSRTFITIIHAPFVALGFLWQMVAGGFYAGRVYANRWITLVALGNITASLLDGIRKTASQKQPAADGTKTKTSGLH
jgi:hypothetical protein